MSGRLAERFHAVRPQGKVIMDENGISRKPDVKRLIADIAMLVGYIVLIAGIGLFLGVSKDVIFSPAAMAVIFAICLLILPLGY